jgi:hypothetical protein
VHGLQDLSLVLLELEWLRSDSIRVLSVAGQREEGGELVPSKAEFLIKGLVIGGEAADIGAGVRHAEKLRAEDALQAEVERVPGSLVVGVRLRSREATCGSEGATGKEEGALVVIEFGAY